MENKLFEQHKQKMRWVFEDICFVQYCDVCEKQIIRFVYSKPKSDLACCSFECVDEYYNY
jgi:hypothetical protein